MFNCTILPKHHCDGEHIETVHIFRCAVMPQRYLVDRRIPPSKNHFVALCQPINNIELKPGEHYFSPQLPQQPSSTSASSTVVEKPASTSTLTSSMDVKKQASTSSSIFSMDVKKPSTSASSKKCEATSLNSFHLLHDCESRYSPCTTGSKEAAGCCSPCQKKATVFRYFASKEEDK